MQLSMWTYPWDIQDLGLDAVCWLSVRLALFISYQIYNLTKDDVRDSSRQSCLYERAISASAASPSMIRPFTTPLFSSALAAAAFS